MKGEMQALGHDPLLVIFSQCSLSDLLALALTCKAFRSVYNDEYLWMLLLERDYCNLLTDRKLKRRVNYILLHRYRARYIPLHSFHTVGICLWFYPGECSCDCYQRIGDFYLTLNPEYTRFIIQVHTYSEQYYRAFFHDKKLFIISRDMYQPEFPRPCMIEEISLLDYSLPDSS